MDKMILDNGVFRSLVTKDPSKDVVKEILKHINKRLPVRVVTPPYGWDKYVGVSRKEYVRPKLQNEFAVISSRAEYSEVVDNAIQETKEAYQALNDFSAETLERKTREFLTKRVNTKSKVIKDIATDIVMFDGWENFSFKQVSEDLAMSYAIDEVFYNFQFLPVSLVDCMNYMARDLKLCAQKYHTLPIFRFVDSLLKYIERIHIEDPDSTSEESLKELRKAAHGFKQLKPGETDDCTYVWNAVQGIYTKEGLKPVTLVTMDKQLVNRTKLLLEVLSAKFEEISFLASLHDDGLLTPGKLLVLDHTTGEKIDEVDFAPLLHTFVEKSYSY